MPQRALGIIVALSIVTPALAINGNVLALRSSSFDVGTSNVMTANGYVGTYVDLAAPGSVTITVNAQGYAANSIDPHMNIAINDTRIGFDVPATAANYEYTFDLPAGRHFVRTEFNNNGGTLRALQVNTLNVAGATAMNTNNNENAFAAAETYTQNYRKGNTTVHVPALAPGTEVQVKLVNHAYKFGAAVPAGVLIPNPAPGSFAEDFQQALTDNRFNSITAGNSGKWSSNEPSRDSLSMTALDQMITYTQSHDMEMRAHNLIWASQQPGWVNTLLTNAVDDPGTGDDAAAAAAKADLRGEITERIQYYVQNRAQAYYQIDVYNESWHTGVDTAGSNNYWDIYGASGIAEIYKEVKNAAVAGGGQMDTFTNEYNVLVNGADDYANWYLRHVEDIQEAGQILYGPDERVVTGIGFQYYANGIGQHSVVRIVEVLQNMAVQDLPFALTEWGVTGNSSDPVAEFNASTILAETARLMFGMPGSVGFTQWDIRSMIGGFAPVGSLYDSDWTIRDTGVAWQALMDEWDTDLTLNVNPDGTIDFNGFYGDYEITVGVDTYDFTLNNGDEDDIIHDLTIDGDTDGDGDVDFQDFVNVQNYFGEAAPESAGDADGDGDSDFSDFVAVQNFFGSSVGGPGLAFVPEPASLGLLSFGGLMLVMRRRQILRQGSR